MPYDDFVPSLPDVQSPTQENNFPFISHPMTVCTIPSSNGTCLTSPVTMRTGSETGKGLIGFLLSCCDKQVGDDFEDHPPAALLIVIFSEA